MVIAIFSRPICVQKQLHVLPVLMLVSFMGLAQDEKQKDEPFGVEGQFTFETDRPYKLLELDAVTEEPIVVGKKKKTPRNVFYGLKTRRLYTRRGKTAAATVEIFHGLKTQDAPPPFVKEVYWYDFKRKEIRRSEKFDPTKGILLHGPYRKMQGEALIEEGIYFKGARHGRWMKYTRDGLLEDKEKYYKGWPKESLVSYYDAERKKVKELIPVEYGEREGNYYLFHENGTVAVQGEFKQNKRAGDWFENFPNGRRKKIISYGANPFDRKNRPFTKREWDENGRETYVAPQLR